jgi:hypothetical protein
LRIMAASLSAIIMVAAFALPLTRDDSHWKVSEWTTPT